MSRGKGISQRKEPIRQCMGCREHKPKKELCRVVRSPEGEVSIDFKGKSPGRGVYICLDAECFKRVRKNRGLERSLQVKISEAVFNEIQENLEQSKHC